VIELRPTDVAHGGEAVARLDGKVHFVEGAMPGEVVRGEVVRSNRRWARVELTEVVEPSPMRVEPPCRHFGVCGGCRWQFAEHAAQLEWKRSIVAGQLAHLGGIADPPVGPTVSPGPAYGYRTRADFEVLDGRPAFHRRGSSDLTPIDTCLVLHPLVAGVVPRLADLDGTEEVTVRASVSSGEVLAVVRGRVPDSVGEWGCAVARRDGERILPLIGTPSITETVDGSTLRISGDAFFQNNAAGAATLVGLVTEALDPRPDDTLLDAYAGGGLFGATVGRRAGHVTAVEWSVLAVADLSHNLAGMDHTILSMPVAEIEGAGDWDLAVLDPPRRGLGAEAVRAIASGGPRAIAYVSCDPASLARDTRDLGDAGYHLDAVTPVDMFPQTFHVEAVATFTRG
jgi:23S rRNA (uracil1939-C5)-methyltransferase